MGKQKNMGYEVSHYVTVGVNGLLLRYPIYKGIDYDKQMKEISNIVRRNELKRSLCLSDINEAEKIRKLEDKKCPKCQKRSLRIYIENSSAILCCEDCNYERVINLNKYKRINYENR